MLSPAFSTTKVSSVFSFYKVMVKIKVKVMVYIKAEGQSWIISALYVLEVYYFTVPRLLLQIQGQGQGLGQQKTNPIW